MHEFGSVVGLRFGNRRPKGRGRQGSAMPKVVRALVETCILFGDRPRPGQILSQKHSAAFGISEEITSSGRIKLEKKKN